MHVDVEGLYAEALELEGLVSEHNKLLLEFRRLEQDRFIELMEQTTAYEGEALTGYCWSQANKDVAAGNKELADKLDEMSFRVSGLKAKHDAIIAAGWAVTLDNHSYIEELRADVRKSLPEGE